jgi:hypothetical protein
MTTETDAAHPRAAALILIAQFAAMGGAFLILGSAINWPASLDLPPAEILPLLQAKQGAVFAGYLSYLIHALLLIPLAVLVPRILGASTSLSAAILGLGLLAALAKSLGIVRWLVLMPELAAAWSDPAAEPAARVAVGVVYHAFNAYAGGVGEVLGVGLFTGVWTALLSLELWRAKAPALAGFGLIAALELLATLFSVVGIESAILLTGSGIFWQVWSVALAWWLWSRRSAGGGEKNAAAAGFSDDPARRALP